MKTPSRQATIGQDTSSSSHSQGRARNLASGSASPMSRHSCQGKQRAIAATGSIGLHQLGTGQKRSLESPWTIHSALLRATTEVPAPWSHATTPGTQAIDRVTAAAPSLPSISLGIALHPAPRWMPRERTQSADTCSGVGCRTARAWLNIPSGSSYGSLPPGHGPSADLALPSSTSTAMSPAGGLGAPSVPAVTAAVASARRSTRARGMCTAKERSPGAADMPLPAAFTNASFADHSARNPRSAASARTAKSGESARG